MAVTEQQASAIFEKINTADTRLFYIKIPVEYGKIGAQSNKSS